MRLRVGKVLIMQQVADVDAFLEIFGDHCA